jgi:integrase
MQEKRIVVWVQRFKDRDSLMLQWIDPDSGKRKSKSAETHIPAVAEMKRTELEYELNHGLHKEATRMSWEAFRELFEKEHISGCRPRTAISYAEAFDCFERLCKPTTLKSITTRTISAYVGTMRQQKGRNGNMQESTIKVRLQFLHGALRWALRQKLITEMPDFPKIRPPKRRPQPVPPETFERLLSKAEDTDMRAFLLSGWLAGLRLNEACCLEWEETEASPYLDLDRNRIIFPAGFVKAVEDQWVPLDRELREAVLELPQRKGKVFRYKGRPCHPRMMQIYIQKIAQKAGVKLTMKSLRRGFGCYWAARVSAQVLQKLMRHSTIALTMTYYANVDDAAMQAVLEREPSLRNTSRNSSTALQSSHDEPNDATFIPE